MSPQERSSLVAIAANLLVNGVLLVRLWQLHAAGALDGPEATTRWAQVVVWAIPALLGVILVTHVVLRLVIRDEDGGALMDERDRLFQVRGMIVTIVVFSLGWVATLVGLASGWGPLAGFLVTYYAATVGDLLGNGTRVLCYRLGA